MPADRTRRRVAILGCGYVGSALGRALAQAGHDVVATTTTPERTPAIRELGVTPVVIRLAETNRLPALLADPDAVYLTVAAGQGRGNYRAVYLDGTKQLLAALQDSRVTRVVYTSSSAVHGQRDGGWVDEQSPTEPAEANARVLLETEQALLAGIEMLRKQRPLSATVLRLCGIYGSGRDPLRWIESSAGSERTDGDGYLNLIHLDDIVAALVRLLEAPYHGVLNLNDDCPTLRRVFYDRLLAAAGLPPIRWVQPSGPPDLGKRVRNDLLKQTLGLTLKHPNH